MTTAPARPTGQSSWHSTINTLPGEEPAATPYHSRAWAHAWQSISSEPVLASRHLALYDGSRRYRLSYQLIESSPMWTAVEGDAGLPEPVWQEPVLYAPSIYGEYGGLPGASPLVLAEAVDRGMELAREWGAPALVVPNLPPADLEQWTAIRPPDAQVCLYWAHRAPVASSLEKFVANFSSSKCRSDFRRQHRRGTEAGLRLRIAPGTAMRDALPDFVAQACATSQQHGPALYGLDMLTPLMHAPGAVALLAEHDDGLAGGLLCFRHNGVLYLWAAAIDQDRKAVLHTYGWLMAESIAYAVATGTQVLDAGRGNYEYKSRLGFGTIPLTSAIYLTQPDPAAAGRLQAMHTGLQEHAMRAWGH
ncbi:GNAT family N-acetyltransferase [Streptomyces sp. NBC_01433]|uniref:GNAT family N-acetyltransferase n=1 Tax=Streptomyces sp. NBC_01433 TaxID=2903864 RepID=UPI00225A0E56|nr:GNAT family N-acetyltransferase [Streptomyces sp. NBC_01433]MCX4681341.1 GNAT family N-acetyltransferase [Streptomyces sp. NBC_01433]MCX4681721.1 GNAT family N-acetyltransferase [Streptomyces sp. NBC_01433]MCX4682417.1 GNAT family N-acetyltransferase [Streptomyces sp. NBC_01433]